MGVGKEYEVGPYRSSRLSVKIESTAYDAVGSAITWESMLGAHGPCAAPECQNLLEWHRHADIISFCALSELPSVFVPFKVVVG